MKPVSGVQRLPVVWGSCELYGEGVGAMKKVSGGWYKEGVVGNKKMWEAWDVWLLCRGCM